MLLIKIATILSIVATAFAVPVVELTPRADGSTLNQQCSQANGQLSCCNTPITPTAISQLSGSQASTLAGFLGTLQFLLPFIIQNVQVAASCQFCTLSFLPNQITLLIYISGVAFDVNVCATANFCCLGGQSNGNSNSGVSSNSRIFPANERKQYLTIIPKSGAQFLSNNKIGLCN